VWWAAGRQVRTEVATGVPASGEGG